MSGKSFYVGIVTLAILFVGSRPSDAEPVELQTKAGLIKGTLLLPDAPKPCPLVIIIAGSGPTDRDGNNPLGGKNDSLKLLAEGLAAKGIGSLRFDKRGIGESAKALAKEADIRFEAYIDDVVEWGKKFQNDPRFSSVIILGHSEGSLIGMVACWKLGAKGFVSIAGSGRPAADLILSQLEPKLPPANFEEVKTIVEKLKKGETVKDVPPADPLFRPSVQPYIISWFKYDPAVEIGKLKVPALVIQGTTDIQARAEDAKLLKAACKNADLFMVEGMNHIMKKVSADQAEQIKSYGDPSLPVVPELLDRIAAFVKSSDGK
jgi:uncharacterized protein